MGSRHPRPQAGDPGAGHPGRDFYVLTVTGVENFLRTGSPASPRMTTSCKMFIVSEVIFLSKTKNPPKRVFLAQNNRQKTATPPI